MNRVLFTQIQTYSNIKIDQYFGYQKINDKDTVARYRSRFFLRILGMKPNFAIFEEVVDNFCRSEIHLDAYVDVQLAQKILER